MKILNPHIFGKTVCSFAENKRLPMVSPLPDAAATALIMVKFCFINIYPRSKIEFDLSHLIRAF